MKLVVTSFLFLTIFFANAQDITPVKIHKQEVDSWHENRVKGLKKEHGWLSLIALEWIQEGKNTLPSIGVISLKQGTLHLELNKKIKGLLNKKEFSSGVIVADKDKVLLGSKALMAIKRGDKYAVRIWDSETSALKNFTTIDRYPVDEHWKIEARWMQYKEPKKIDIPTVIPGLIQYGVAPGIAIFTLNGTEYTLEPTIEEGDDQFFFVFGDKTNGKETYGAGRFLYADQPKNGKIILDFNRSYNPPCVFTDFATCPVPIKENKLTIRIEAGEKIFKHAR
ncbi:MAG: DUF1684 domain-containing protein [Bacteroidota bacterium]